MTQPDKRGDQPRPMQTLRQLYNSTLFERIPDSLRRLVERL